METTLLCPKCGAAASYSTLGEMYELRCTNCKHEEAGMFLPSFGGMPRARPVDVVIHIGNLAPTGKNLFALSKLHPKLAQMSPVELKAVFLSGGPVRLGAHTKEDAERVKVAAAKAGFVALCSE